MEESMSNKGIRLLKIIGMLISFFVGFIVSTNVATAAEYPTKPIRLVVPFPPGGSNDIIGRLIAAKLTERLGKQVVVDNRGGAGGVIGAEIVAKAEPDGHTLLINAAGYAVSPALYKLPYDPKKSFSPISKLASGPMALTVHPGVPAHSVKELIALAKQNPGKLICPSSGMGSNQHLASELFKMRAGIDFKIVQFKGSNPANIDQLGGHSHFSIAALISQLPHIKSEKLRLLALGGLKRSAIMPDVPTIAEAGVPGYDASQWWGILTPAGTPAPVVDRLNREIKTLLSSADVRKMFMTEGADVDYLGPVEFGSFIETEISKWAKVVKEANIKVD
jgi:tripartite-type tricarboxylate transporter receptor subunit TctC